MVKDGVWYGIILAVFKTEPYALMMTAAHVIDCIKAEMPAAVSYIQVAASTALSSGGAQP